MITFRDYLIEGKDKRFDLHILSDSGKLLDISFHDIGLGFKNLSLDDLIKKLHIFGKDGFKYICVHEIQRLVIEKDPSLLGMLYDKENTLDPYLRRKYSNIVMGDKFGVFEFKQYLLEGTGYDWRDDFNNKS